MPVHIFTSSDGIVQMFHLILVDSPTFKITTTVTTLGKVQIGYQSKIKGVKHLNNKKLTSILLFKGTNN